MGDIFVHPVKTHCKHTFCLKCLQRHLRDHDKLDCPLCRKEITSEHPPRLDKDMWKSCAEMAKQCLPKEELDRVLQRLAAETIGADWDFLAKREDQKWQKDQESEERHKLLETWQTMVNGALDWAHDLRLDDPEIYPPALEVPEDITGASQQMMDRLTEMTTTFRNVFMETHKLFAILLRKQVEKRQKERQLARAEARVRSLEDRLSMEELIRGIPVNNRLQSGSEPAPPQQAEAAPNQEWQNGCRTM